MGAAGVVLRIVLIVLAPHAGFVGDHVANMMWGGWAADRGLLEVYRLDIREMPPVPAMVPDENGKAARLDVHPTWIGKVNHPPLAVLLYTTQSLVLRAIDDEPVLNTLSSRVVCGASQALFDLALSLIIGALAASIHGSGAFFRGFTAAWLFVPLALNSVFWGQIDTVFLTFACGAVALMLSQRWRSAGAVLAISLLVKPQAVLLAPVVLVAVFAAPGASPIAVALRRIRDMGGAMLLVLAIGSAPWLAADGLAWAERCYVDNILHAYPSTSLKAFNVWYLDVLRLDGTPSLILDSNAILAGLSKDTWGRVALVTALVLALVLAWRRRPVTRTAVVVFAALWLWSTFMWPTRVHERYIIYCVPFVIVLAVARRAWLAPCLALFVVASAEHTWNVWARDLPAGSLVTRNMIQDRLQSKVEAHAALPDEHRAMVPAPRFDDAAAEIRAEAEERRDEYLAARKPVFRIELALTLLSILGYSLAARAGWTCGAPLASNVPESRD